MDYSLWSNGVPMDTEAFRVFEFNNRRGLPPQRSAELFAHGQEGSTLVFGGTDTKTYTLKMWVDHLTPDGRLSTNPRAQFERNMSTVAGFFSHRGLWTLSQRMPDGSMRFMKVRTRQFEDQERFPGSEAPIADVTVVLDNPGGWATDRTVPAVHHSTVFNTPVPVHAFRPDVAKGVLADATLTVWGAGSNIRFECGSAWIRHVGPLAANQRLVIDCGRQRVTKYTGTSPTGVSALRDITWGGGVGMFDMQPPHIVTVTATGGSAWRIEGFPKFN